MVLVKGFVTHIQYACVCIHPIQIHVCTYKYRIHNDLVLKALHVRGQDCFNWCQPSKQSSQVDLVNGVFCISYLNIKCKVLLYFLGSIFPLTLFCGASHPSYPQDDLTRVIIYFSNFSFT